ncbi:MAG TPA: Na+:solute symporter [Phycisphaerae bacterium]|nr:Na+:solute symporter [Phycisphaerae bacterium]
MRLQAVDWVVVIAFFAIALLIGMTIARRAGRNTAEYFLSGRAMPWWLLGTSMVATTFSADTPNLVTNLVREDGVAGNWVWWSFLLSGMLTVFVFSRLWRRSGVTTDLEFYELRYSGRPAAFLRGFRAIYLGVFVNMWIMATVSLAAIKIGRVLLDFSPMQTIIIASTVTVIFSAMGGLRAVVLTDFLLFIVAMIGSIAAASVAIGQPQIGGLGGLMASDQLVGKLSILPSLTRENGSSNLDTVVTVLIIPIAVQWWSVWYPGSEPGGGGYVAQRMLSARNETHAIGATLLFNVAHYALRPWPWILVALCSLVVYPLDAPADRLSAREALASPEIHASFVQFQKDPTSLDDATRSHIEELVIQERGLTAIRSAFPNAEYGKIGHDLAYPAMMTLLPTGWLGLVIASLIAAYMSTISTHLNWGSSYVVNDFWRRFVRRGASERELVWIGRLSTVLLMIGAGFLALGLGDAAQAFGILVQIGAGTGLLFILRWFWWRINPFSEIAAMVISLIVAVYMQFWAPTSLAAWQKLVVSVGVTTAGWMLVTMLTPADAQETLRRFYRLIRPGGPGWGRVVRDAERSGESLNDAAANAGSLPLGILCMVVGCVAVYAALFATGHWIYGHLELAIVLSIIAIGAGAVLAKLWPRVAGDSPAGP